ncbi:MAG: hypothetical protein L0Y44_11140 [Phycisphaerales bacterium]|nr:hypothetical protein [Phycisphaerales bacterium]MCI0631193.1 hypothetical protein [Phycisphaerales bacterium]MCI0676418.1 hypothetical protein [Phycisphaerales bacterium]
MADRVRKVNYGYITVPAKAGSGAKALGELKDAKINMLGFCGFPTGGGKGQLDFLVPNPAALQRVARANKWKLSPVKKAFLVEGSDRAGAVHSNLRKLGAAGINVTAAQAVSTGNRYGMIVWVKPKDYAKAARTLGAR